MRALVGIKVGTIYFSSLINMSQEKPQESSHVPILKPGGIAALSNGTRQKTQRIYRMKYHYTLDMVSLEQYMYFYLNV
jgi:hypothetical protein